MNLIGACTEARKKHMAFAIPEDEHHMPTIFYPTNDTRAGILIWNSTRRCWTPRWEPDLKDILYKSYILVDLPKEPDKYYSLHLKKWEVLQESRFEL